MNFGSIWLAAGLCVALGSSAAVAAGGEEEAPAKRGGILTYTIPADAPPSFDARNSTFSRPVLQRADPRQPGEPDLDDRLCLRANIERNVH
jgi:hypothetical protein